MIHQEMNILTNPLLTVNEAGKNGFETICSDKSHAHPHQKICRPVLKRDKGTLLKKQF
jgi:hypothetical protein